MRSASPAIASTVPMASVRGVGCASQNARTPNTNPAATRRRAIAVAIRCRPIRSATRSSRRQALLHGRGNLGDADVFETPVRLVAASIDVASAPIGARDDEVAYRPRSVSRRIGRAKDADGWRADSHGNVQRTRVACDKEIRRSTERDDVADAGWRCEDRRVARPSDDRLGKYFLTWSPQDDRDESDLAD